MICMAWAISSCRASDLQRFVAWGPTSTRGIKGTPMHEMRSTFGTCLYTPPMFSSGIAWQSVRGKRIAKTLLTYRSCLESCCTGFQPYDASPFHERLSHDMGPTA